MHTDRTRQDTTPILTHSLFLSNIHRPNEVQQLWSDNRSRSNAMSLIWAESLFIYHLGPHQEPKLTNLSAAPLRKRQSTTRCVFIQPLDKQEGDLCSTDGIKGRSTHLSLTNPIPLSPAEMWFTWWEIIHPVSICTHLTLSRRLLCSTRVAICLCWNVHG